MPHRAPSPARSEAEYDISNALVASAHEDHDVGPQNASELLDVMGEEFDIDDEAIIAQQQTAANRKASNLKGRTTKKGGGFQALGLNANLHKAIARKGYSVPTPIQRKTIPLLLNEKDVVGMARTGSGKTAAFVIPMIEKLKAHSTKVGARALIMSPSRELALQTLQVVKDLGRGTDLRSILLVGGDSLEEQFASMANNPDVIIATPGRFLHLKVEMNLDLSSIQYVVFDEADRLFEMGFAAQLTEILHALPAARQTLLFSATLPKSLVEFARAGLQEPVLVRLDADSKISPDLQNAFFTIKSSEKEGALLHILQDIIQIPAGSQVTGGRTEFENGMENPKKRKLNQSEKPPGLRNAISPFSTIVFAATKHHVEYLAQFLRLAGYAISHIYGSLDQTARKEQVQAFRSGQTSILVVTDVAARGIDIPILANVINYDFPSQPKVFVHRVGRTARAGQKGWSYSIIHGADAPYLLDLQLFLGRKLQVGRTQKEKVNYAEDVVVGSLQRDNLQTCCEWVSRTLDIDGEMASLRSVASKGEKLYQRTRNSASSESAKRARNLITSNGWTELHPLFSSESNDLEAETERMLALVGGFRPQESVFEISARRGGRKGNEEAIDAMRKIRSGLEFKKQKSHSKKSESTNYIQEEDDERPSEDEHQEESGQIDDISMASDSELEVTFSHPQSTKSKRYKLDPEDGLKAFRDTENFMSYKPVNSNLDEERAYGVQSGSNSNFTEAARGATMDLAQDEAGKSFGEARGIMRWDKRQKKYVAKQNDDDGSKGKRLVKGESGAKIAASFRAGRYDAWRKANKVGRVPRVGEAEAKATTNGVSGKRYRHESKKAPKEADKLRGNYETQRKRATVAKERNTQDVGKKELRSVDDIRKVRNMKDKRREKNSRPSKRKGR